MKIILDTNFVVTCTKQKLDFFNLAGQIIDEQIFWLVPTKVLEELEKISVSKTKKLEDKKATELFFELFDMHRKGKTEIEIIKLKIQNVDDAIKNYCDKNPAVILATLDKKLKTRVNNNILTLKGKKFLRLV